MTGPRETPARPVRPEERIPILDILRGFALLGIVILSMGGDSRLPMPPGRSGPSGSPGDSRPAIEAGATAG